MFKKKKIKEKCKECFYHNKASCKRYPPTITDKNGAYAEYPLVYDDGWCGEFRNVA